MNLSELATAIAELIKDSVSTVRVENHQPDQLAVGVADAVYLSLSSVDYQEAFNNGLAMVEYTATVVVPAQDMRSAHIRMMDLLSSGAGENRSIIDAVMDARTLGGLTGGLCVDRMSDLRVENDGEARRLVCDLTMRVPAGRL